jgi:hypothetical protein
MSVPDVYTESALANFMRYGILRKTADVLGWLVQADYQEAIDQTLLDYGVSDISDALNIPKLRSLARMNAWKAVMEANVPAYQATADGATFHRDQIYDHARQQYMAAVSDASPFLNRVVRTEATDIELTW